MDETSREGSTQANEPAESLASSRLGFALIVSLFFLSGFASLVYQVVWTRELVFVFGSTTFASSTVLAVFMGGLALGSFIAGRYCDQMPLKKALLWYGLLEGVIGAWALVAPFLFDAAIPLYRVIWQHSHLSLIPFSLLRFGTAVVILLLPTAAMGATLPLLSRYVVANIASVGSRVGTLYAVNTLGATAGAMIAGFVLLPAFGLNATTYIAAAGNFILCLVVITLVGKQFKAAESAKEPAPKADDTKFVLTKSLAAGLISFCLSGAIAMIYEVGWTRALLMVIGSTTYAFTVMLSTFLVGIFGGSLLAANIADKTSRPMFWFAVCQILLFVSGLLAIGLFNYVPYWSEMITVSAGHNTALLLFLKFLLSGVVLLPISLLLGATFPFIVKACTPDLKVLGQSVGVLYSSNTLGAIIGAFLAGFVVVPLFGAERTLMLCAGANLIVGAFALYHSEIGKPRIAIAISVGAVMVCVGVFFSPGIWDPLALLCTQSFRRTLTSGAATLPPYDVWLKSFHQSRKLLAWFDGPCATVGVTKHVNGAISLLTNGHVDATDGLDMGTQVSLAAFPIAANPTAKEICVIGWGSGVTGAVAAAQPKVRVTGVEIEPAVIKASKLFAHVNDKSFAKPNVELEYNDGRNFLLATDRKFDVIVSEPSNPWQAGVCNLFTQQFFQSSRRCLADGGVFALWLQTYEVSPENVKRVLSALQSVYPYVMPMQGTGADVVVLASSTPIILDFKTVDAMLKEPQLMPWFKSLNIRSPADLFARIIANSAAVANLVKSEQPNSDDRNRLEYEVARTYETASFKTENQRMFAANCGDLLACVNWDNMTPSEKVVSYNSVARAALTLNPSRAIWWAEQSNRIEPNADAFRIASMAYDSKFNDDKELPVARQVVEAEPDNVFALRSLASVAYKYGELGRAKKLLQHALQLDANNLMVKFDLCRVYLPSARKILNAKTTAPDDAAAAEPLLAELENDSAFRAQHFDLLSLRAAALADQGEVGKARQLLVEYLVTTPTDITALRRASELFTKEGNKAEAADYLARSYIAAQPLSVQLYFTAQTLLRSGHEDAAVFQLDRAYEADPRNDMVKDLLKKLSQTNLKAQAALRGTSKP